MKRIIFGCIGVLATVIAILGVWLPGVPTTMPLLIALWAFSKSSARLEAMLERVPVLRLALVEARRFERERSIRWQVKLVAQVSAWTSAVVVGLLTRSVMLAVILGMVAVTCTIFMIYIPTRKKSAATNDAHSSVY